MEEKVKVKGIPGSTLKIIAIIAMLIDHIGAVVLEGWIQQSMSDSMTTEEAMQWLIDYGAIYYTDMLLRLIGRFGFPLFCFLLIEGFTHTGNIRKYIRNLAVFALVSELPFNLATSGKLFNPEYQNVFFTLLIGLLTLTAMKALAEDRTWSKKLVPLFYVSGFGVGALAMWKLKSSTFGSLTMLLGQYDVLWKELLIGGVIGLVIMSVLGAKWSADQKNSFMLHAFILIAGVLVADALMTDYSGWGIITIALMYFFRSNKFRSMLVGCISLTVMSFIEATAFFMLIPVSKYNGQRGLKIKYFFYVFYPVHLFILYLIAYFLGFRPFMIR